MEQALSDMKVLDLTHHIAGPYATKLLADYGADVIKIEKPGEGDPTRHMGPFPGDVPHREKSGLFLHLNTNKRSVTLDLKSDPGRKTFLDLARNADLVVESFRPGIMASLGLDYSVIERVNPTVVMASISNFGQTGPYRDFKASDLVLAGMGGSQSSGGIAEKPPLKIANSVTQYLAGLSAADGILAALFLARRRGVGQYLDLSLFQLLVSFGDSRGTGTARYKLTGGVEARPSPGGRMTPFPPQGVHPCKDGYMEWFGVTRWPQAAAMVKRPDFLTDPRYATPAARQSRIEEINAILASWMMERTKRQCWEEAAAADMIAAPCNTIEDLFNDPHVGGRGFWVQLEHPVLGKTAIPGRPFIMNESPWQLRRPAPLLGQHNAEVLGELRASAGQPDGGEGSQRPAVNRAATHALPLEGIRVLDMCPMQAGNMANLIMGDLGAQVIKVESTQHFQYGVRGQSARPTKEQVQGVGAGHGYPNNDPGPTPWNVYGQILTFSRNKLSLTVDLRRPAGVEAFKRLIKVTDVVIESNTPPVLPRLGLDYPQLREANPQIIMVRMPGYGLSGPYRDRPGMAQTLESFSGHTLLRGYPDVRPPDVGTSITSDGAAGAGAVVAALTALHFRARTGKGQLVEFAQVENFMPLMGEFYMDYIFNKRLRGPMGNRPPSAVPWGCYPCAGADQWIDITVHTDEEWRGLRRALGDPQWARDPRFDSSSGRYQNQDELDEQISAWTRTRDRYDIMHLLQGEGVPCGPVLNSKDLFSDPHLVARSHFQDVTHPLAGTYAHPAPPWKMSRTPLRIRYPAPLLGEHNDYVYKELLGYSDEECARFEAEGIRGTEPAAHIP